MQTREITIWGYGGALSDYSKKSLGDKGHLFLGQKDLQAENKKRETCLLPSFKTILNCTFQKVP